MEGLPNKILTSPITSSHWQQISIASTYLAAHCTASLLCPCLWPHDQALACSALDRSSQWRGLWPWSSSCQPMWAPAWPLRPSYFFMTHFLIRKIGICTVGSGPILGCVLCPQLSSVAFWDREEEAYLQLCTIQTDLQPVTSAAPLGPEAGLDLPSTPTPWLLAVG